MSGSEKKTKGSLSKLQLLASNSEEEFLKEIRKYDESDTKEIYLRVLAIIEEATTTGDVANFKRSITLFRYLSNLGGAASDLENERKFQNLVISSCKHSSVEILKYLFEILTTCFLCLPRANGVSIKPGEVDNECHNAFYYAIRSNNVQTLDTLIKNWPNNYFQANPEALDTILSQAYEELKLKNISLSKRMEIFVESTIVDLRFFSNNSGQATQYAITINNVKERIGLVLHNINLLKTEFEAKKVDARFLCIAKFITQNMYVLKRQLKHTYDRLPWEEMEFCLIGFICSYTKRQKINMFYRIILNKDRILSHLQHFAVNLERERNLLGDKDINRPIPLLLKRDDVVESLKENFPEFKNLYDDFKEIRDVTSLEKINAYIRLALEADSNVKDEQLIVLRALQVMGEYFKNTLESPKLSNATSELLLLLAPNSTRKIIIDLRNTLSHAYSLSKRLDIEENMDSTFFINIQNDIKKISNIINDVLHSTKVKLLVTLANKIIGSDCSEDLKNMVGDFQYFYFEELGIFGSKSEDNEPIDHKIAKLIDEIHAKVINETEYERQLFEKIKNIMKSKHSNNDLLDNYVIAISVLQNICNLINRKKNIVKNDIRTLKYCANEILKKLIPEIEPQNMEKVGHLAGSIYNSLNKRITETNIDEINELLMKVFQYVYFEVGHIKWIEELREKLDAKYSQLEQKQKNPLNISEKTNYNIHLNNKLTALQTILKDRFLRPEMEQIPSFNDKQQVTVEMLVSDILSIFDVSKQNLVNDLNFLDNSAPLLIGKCLRNHLAHGNAVLDILPFNTAIAVRLNAQKFTAENITSSKKRIGKYCKDDVMKLNDTFNRILLSVTNQNQMFASLKEGNMEELKTCIKRGADICATSFNSQTALHFAAKGPSVHTVKFILDTSLGLLLKKDVDGRSALHVAATNGRKLTVKCLLEKGMPIDDCDKQGFTALHLAAGNNHIDVIKLLLSNRANTRIKNMEGYMPVHLAAFNKCFDSVKVLLEKEENVDFNIASGGFTCLHIAAEVGHRETVIFLLTNQANVQAKNDKDGIPLHVAALNGHLEVVKLLISKGSNVNSRVFDGCTPLHYATETGCEQVVSLLLEKGAHVNVTDNVYNNYPLHLATYSGFIKIVNDLLKNGADINVKATNGDTPLHNAALQGHENIVELLVNYGASVEIRNEFGVTALHCASRGDHVNIMSFLIKRGASVNAKNRFGHTALHVAAERGKISAAALLISEGAEVDIVDVMGITPLHLGSHCCHEKVVQLLISNGAYVNAKTAICKFTPLHFAVGFEGLEDMLSEPSKTQFKFEFSRTVEKRASHTCVNTVQILLQNGADVRLKNQFNCTPLDLACITSNTEIVKKLIEAGAEVNAMGLLEMTPLDLAAQSDHVDIVKVLIEKGSVVNENGGSNNKSTALSLAVKNNHIEIVKALLSAGADVNTNNGEPIRLAISLDYNNVTNTLLKQKNIRIDLPLPDNRTFLHIAAQNGNLRIVEALISKGVDINAIDDTKVTSLFIAATLGHDAIVQVLISNGAKINSQSSDGITPLQIAASFGYTNVVKTLLDNKANVTIRDNKNRIAVELAISRGHLKVVETMMEHEQFDIHAKSKDDFTLLHIAAQNGDLDIIKILVNNGADVHARNRQGSKPIHIAAREDHAVVVEYFLASGFNIHDEGAALNSLLHYAVSTGMIKSAKYLIEQNADVNKLNVNMSRPIHLAAEHGSKDCVMLLLQNGATYNCSDKLKRKPWELSSNQDIIHLLVSTDKLFAAVKRNSHLEVECAVNEGAFVDARNTDNATVLHHACWKGYSEIAKILLKSKANPSAISKDGNTPLHYAAKFGHLEIVKILLSNGAVHDATAATGKTPLDLTDNQGIASLLQLIKQSFQDVRKCDLRIIKKINNIKDFSTTKAVLNARTRDNTTLIVEAMKTNFPKIDKLKEILQGNVTSQMNTAEVLAIQGKYLEALAVYKDALEKRQEILGADDPGTLDIRNGMAKIIYKQGNFKEALVALENIYNIQANSLGPNHKESLSTRSTMALVMHRLGKNEEALPIFKEVFQRQSEVMGLKHSDTLNTQFHMALTLDKLQKFEEALAINYEVLESRKTTLGTSHPSTLSTYNNIAMVLNNQGKGDEALEIYKKVYETRKKIFGPNHSDTLKASFNIAALLMHQKKGDTALTALQEVLHAQQTSLGPNHVDTVNTQFSLALFLLEEGKIINALKTFISCRDIRKQMFGPNHPTVIQTDIYIKTIDTLLKSTSNSSVDEILQDHQSKIITAVVDGNVKLVQDLLRLGCDVNSSDAECRTLLHFAANNNRTDVVNLLLQNGADICKVTKNGNSALHTATANGHKDIVDVLLQHVKKTSPSNIRVIINAKTTTTGSTSLHVAAKRGFIDIVKLLLRYGATYNVTDSQSNKPPLAYSTDARITDFFTLINEVFTCAQNGDLNLINKLKKMQSDDCLAALNAHNTLEQTPIKVATLNKHKVLVGSLVKLLQTCQN